jgi:hypothetical protein
MKRRGATAAYQAERKTKPDVQTAEPEEPPKPAPKMTTRSASVGFRAPVKMKKMSAPAFVEDASDAEEVGGDLNRTSTATPTPEESDEDEEEEGEDDEGGDDEEEQGDDVNKETAVVSISRRLSNAAHALANKGYEN